MFFGLGVVFVVPYDSSKPFVWADYLSACGAIPVPVSVFKQVCTVEQLGILAFL